LTSRDRRRGERENAKARGNQLDAFENLVRAQTGKALTADEAAVLISLADALR
jgi:hypothetical protein